jgi:periplasmic divalent cation tolerance protein
MQEYVLVLVTCPGEETAESIARALVSERLAACVNQVGGVESTYRWAGRVETAGEILLLIKTTRAGYPALEQRVLELHPFDTPEVIAVPLAAGAARYLAWIEDAVGGGKPGE